MNISPILILVGRRLIVFFAAAMLIGSTQAHGHNGAVVGARPVKGITIDGDLTDWPNDVPTHPIARLEFGDKLGDKEDLNARFRIAYDAGEHALYVAVEVRDDSMVIDGYGGGTWNTQDGCELYIDAAHSKDGSPVTQYARNGNRTHTYPEGNEHDVKVAVGRTDSKVVYEWRVDVGGELTPGRSLGFDLSVLDKDGDGSFSWVAWGRGAQKHTSPDRCGDVLLVDPDARFGEISGRIDWQDPSQAPLPGRVRIQSSRAAQLWIQATVDSMGAYEARLPSGPYTIQAVDSIDIRVDEKPHVDVQVEADQHAEAGLLRVTPLPWPGLIGQEGVLDRTDPLDPGEIDRFVQAYTTYYKIPGISIAIVRDAKIVYHRGLGVKDATTGEKVADDTVFEAASMTKPVLAYVVLRLVDRGVLELDTPLHTYLPYEDIAHDDRYKLITARMVLTHRTGFPNWRSGKLDIKFTPGTQVSYSGEGFVYLGKVVEHLTGKKLVDLCQEEVFTPLDIENAYLIWGEQVARATATGHDGVIPLPKWKPDHPNMAASLHIDAQDYAKFLIGIIQGTGLAAPTSAEMLRPQVKVPDQQGTSWGLGISIEESPHGTIYGHGGSNQGFTSRSAIDKDRRTGYVFLVNNQQADSFENVLRAYLIAGKSGLKTDKK